MKCHAPDDDGDDERCPFTRHSVEKSADWSHCQLHSMHINYCILQSCEQEHLNFEKKKNLQELTEICHRKEIPKQHFSKKLKDGKNLYNQRN